MHKYTRSVLGNPSQQGNKTQPNPLLYSSREIPSPPREPSTLDDTYFDSVVLKTTEFCFLLHQEIMAIFTVRQQLDVLFRSTVLSAQSV
jgi:hypothetical protein